MPERALLSGLIPRNGFPEWASLGPAGPSSAGAFCGLLLGLSAHVRVN